MNIKGMSPQLLVKDINASITYYTETLGFELHFRFEDFYAGIKYNEFTVHLKAGEPNKTEQERKKENNDLDIVFAVENVEEWFDTLSGKAVDIILPLCEQPYGREFYIADPDGYILAFLEEN